MTNQEKHAKYTKPFVIDFISRESLVDLGLCSKVRALSLSDGDMQGIADAIADYNTDGNDAYWDAITEAVQNVLNDHRSGAAAMVADPL